MCPPEAPSEVGHSRGIPRLHRWGILVLTDIAIRKAEPRSTAYKLYDGRGLFVFVSPKGHKSWRFKYKAAGKEKLLVLGSYPDLGLKAAREKMEELQRERREGRDPALALRRRRLVGTETEHTFEEMAKRWHNAEKDHWRPVHADDVMKSLERDIFPYLGAFPLHQIDRPLMLAVLQKVENRGAIETAHRLRQRCEAIFHLATSLGIANDNPALGLGKALKKKRVKKRWPALITLAGVRELLKDTDTASASPVTRAASRLIALTGQRPGMIRRMRWSQIEGIDWDDIRRDTSAATWIIAAEDMKLEAHDRADENFDHDVPLVSQAVDLLRRLRELTGSGEYVFWSGRSSRRPMSENALSFYYKRLGYQGRHVPHGWRSSFSTILNEHYADEPSLGVSWERLIDIMLAHVPEGVSSSELRYMRAKFAKQRRQLAQTWADLLLKDAVPLDQVINGARRFEA